MQLIMTTDASLNTQVGAGGWACVIRDAQTKEALERISGGFKRATSDPNIAECWGFINGIHIASKYKPDVITAYTDSFVLFDQFLIYASRHPKERDAKFLGGLLSALPTGLVASTWLHKVGGHGPEAKKNDMAWCDLNAKKMKRTMAKLGNF